MRIDWSKKFKEVVGVVQFVRDVCNKPKVKKLVHASVEAFAAAQPIIDKPTPWNAAKSAFGVGRVIINSLEVDGDMFFGSDDWTAPFGNDFAPTILKVLYKLPQKTIKTNDDGVQIRTVDLGNGVLAGWSHNTKFNSAYHVYVQTEKLTEARSIIKNLLWQQFNGKSLVLRNKRRGWSGNDDSSVAFDIDESFQTLPSQKAVEYTEYLKRCLGADVSRSIMLYGPPGTGKSTLARTLVNELNLRSFRVRIEDVASLDSGTLFEAIQIFEPDAVILDDLDRARGQESLLEVLEFFQHSVKLVIATVNDRNELDEAIMRPGRFDELVEVDRMDENVVKHVLGEYVDGFDVVKTWPIAFIQEYVKRRKFMKDADSAALATIELAQRVQRLQSYRDKGDIERIMSSVEKKVKKKKKAPKSPQ